MIGVVIDTNIVVSANIKPNGSEAQVVSLALNGRIRLFLSQAILEEYEVVLRYPRLKFVPSEITRFLKRLRRSSTIVAPTTSLSLSPDEKDNRFYECAATAKADYLVTGNPSLPLVAGVPALYVPADLLHN
jgi:uncharacterized protein